MGEDYGEGVIARTCQHDVYKGECLMWFDGKEYCPDCFRDEIELLPLEELARLVGAEMTEV